MQKRLQEENDQNNYGEDEDQYEDDQEEGVADNDEMNEDEDEMADTVPVNGPNDNFNQNQYKNGGFDRVQVNQNFQYPGTQKQMAQNNQQQLPQGRLRPQSAKTGDNQQMIYPNNQMGPWGGQVNGMSQEQYNYQVNTLGSQNQQQPGGQMGPYTTQGGQYFQNIPQGMNMSNSKRPTTSNRRNNGQFLVKKAFGTKNPSTIDLEVSRMKPRFANQDRERIIEDAMKEKITANYLKDENIKLKTKIHILEAELNKKEKLVDDLLLQQDSFQVGGPMPTNMKSMSKMKLDSHLTLNLKKKIKDLRTELGSKNEEIEGYKRNIKSTKITELEVEMKLYIDESTRLRHQLEEVIKSKDTFADPEELKLIEGKFQQQELVINTLKNENNELAIAYSKLDDETRKLRDFIGDMERKQKKALGASKEASKLKKVIKEKEREIGRINSELKSLKILNEEFKAKVEELVKKPQQSASNFNSRSQNVSQVYNQNSGFSQIQNDQEKTKLKQQLQEKDEKITEINNVVQQLQQKLQEKQKELTKESSEKQKFKDLYEKYQNQVAKLEAQHEDGFKRQPTNPSKPKEQNLDKSLTKDNKPAQQKQQLNKSNEQEKKIARVDQKQVRDIIVEMRLKLQVKCFYSNQLKDFFFKPYSSNDMVSIKQLKSIIESNGFSESASLLLARYIIEPKANPQLVYNPDLQTTQSEIISNLTDLIGHYNLFNDANQAKKYQEKINKIFAGCKSTLKDTVQLEDYDDEGIVSLNALKEAFTTLEIDIDEEILDFMIFMVYQKSESIEKMKYQVLFDLIDGKVLQGQLSGASDGLQSRKRPESSSPEKLKARNKEKYNSQQSEQEKQTKIQKIKQEDDDEEEEDNYEEEFEKLLDKDDEEEEPKDNKVQKKPTMIEKKTQEVDSQKEDGEAEGENDEEYIDEEEMLDVAEKCFVKIAEGIINKGTSVRKAFQGFIIKEDLEGEIIELLSPIGFLEGLKDLGIVDLEEVEVACLLRVLTKQELENAILLKELIIIMENFGIQDDEENYDDDEEQEQEQQIPASSQKVQEPLAKPQESVEQESQPKKKKKKAGGKQMDLSQLDEKSIKILAKLMLALMELNASLYDFFEGAIYEQLVKTKTKQNVIEIIAAKDFFGYLQTRGVRKSEKIHDNLLKFLQLDPNYPDLIMIKKIAKALDEMSKNEDLMSGILAAAEGEDMDAAEGNGDEEDEDPQNQKKQLRTIGEDGSETYQTNKGLTGQQKQQVEEDEYEEEDDNYAF